MIITSHPAERPGAALAAPRMVGPRRQEEQSA